MIILNCLEVELRKKEILSLSIPDLASFDIALKCFFLS